MALHFKDIATVHTRFTNKKFTMSNSASNRSKSEFLLMPNPLQVGERLDYT